MSLSLNVRPYVTSILLFQILRKLNAKTCTNVQILQINASHMYQKMSEFLQTAIIYRIH